MLGSIEFILIVIMILLLFGPDKLPEFGKALGKAMGDFRKVRDLTRSGLHNNTSSTNKFSGVDSKIRTMVEEAVLKTNTKSDDEIILEKALNNNEKRL
ncbi:MAG: hypothetical protein PWP14_35 [Methanolobus sp.]|jgi:TatA/E family protein of Tat protein translocase|nr:hypothetical protein [Methanolobus sp.]